jgi:membrane protein
MYGSATVYITSRVTTAAQEVELIGFFSQFLFFGLNLLPYMLIWLLFTFTYLLMPNTTVRLIPGIIAGIVASTIFQLTQGAYINFQVIVSKYNAIYGSFAALPLFLIWMQVSWLIVLFGAELSYAFQNSSRYEFEGDLASISQGHKKLIALKIAHMIVKTFARGLNPLSATQIIDKLKLPHHLVQTILNEMVVAEVLSLTPAKKGDGYAYLPSCDVQFYTINSVLKALDQNGSANIPASEYGDDQNIKDAVKMFAEAVDNLPSNRQLSDI